MSTVRSRRRAPRVIAALAALLTLVLAGCGSGGGTSNASSGSSSGGSTEKHSVTMTSFTGSFASLSVYTASRKGMFTKHGIDPNFVQVTSGAAAMQALLAGSADMANVAIFESLTARSKGEDVKYIVGAATGSFGELVVSKSLDLPNASKGYPDAIRDLKGKRIGVSSKGSATYYALSYTLKQAGLDPDKDVTIVPAGNLPAQLTAMKAGQLDGFMSQEPVTSQAVKNGDGKVIYTEYQGSRPKLFEHLITNGIVTTDKYLGANAATVKGVHDAVAEADSYIAGLDKAGTQELAKLVSPDFPGVDTDSLALGIQHYQKLYSATMSKAGVDAANQLLEDAGVLSSPVAYDDVVAKEAQG